MTAGQKESKAGISSKPLRIAIQGYEGSFHQEAARKFFGKNVEVIPCDNFRQVIKIASDKNVVVHCRSGVRSAKAIQALEKKYGFKNLYNLKGGILAWASEIDPTMAKY